MHEYKMDVIMCTWNSNKPWFRNCLNNIKREVPLHHFILVDKYSNDGTIEIVNKIFRDVIVVITDENLASARKKGIEYVDTDFFCFH